MDSIFHEAKPVPPIGCTFVESTLSASLLPMIEQWSQPRYRLLERSLAGTSGSAIEQALLFHAGQGIAVAHVWESTPGFVVPPSYRRFERFEVACESSAAVGLPVNVLRFGRGLVPQGPGVVNLSLAWRTQAMKWSRLETVYAALCQMLQGGLGTFGILATEQAVPGSFSKGHYHLAVDGRKVAGTAQYWRRISNSEQVVLAHAYLLVDADLETLVRQANEFEAVVGSNRVYVADAITNVAYGAKARGRSFSMGGTRRRITPSHVQRLLQHIASSSAVLC
ncbi:MULTISPECIES: lipoate--protein ligase family protein [unclassified Methylibium]|uniref:lipoyl protein ligase domain-containing protein n=1 Tax=unclassified Methylibium TaxID=2633235 RepID=UPI0003F3D057|nr:MULTISPECIES: lipoate--protein ligase family protein [unclassified Methylibium]EWS53966.1 Lipoate-protein ligase A [Methylibium sp. T29]EWS58293.1 Lipoate-protein ligase A [Methylibium sp. T29-B]